MNNNNICSLRLLIILVALICLLPFALTAQTFTQDFTSGAGSFVVPEGVTEITIEVWGGGGQGGNTSKSGGNQTISAGGGGGGAYSLQVQSVTEGQTLLYQVGAGSNSSEAGGASYVIQANSEIVKALGGNSVNPNASSGASGGQASGGIGQVRFSGGNGASGIGENAGGGGSSAGASQNGANASGINGGSAPSGGGNGGNGATSSPGNGEYNGSTGSTPGAGGGGSAVRGGGFLDATGGAGANGLVRFTWTVEEPGFGGETTNCPDGGTQSSVTDVASSRVERPEQLNLYQNGNDTYSFAVGTDNDLLLDAFQVNNELSFALDRIADRIELRRNGNAGQGPSGQERHILFFENAPSFGGNNKDFLGAFASTMEDALLCSCINRGSDNIFANAGPNRNNIQRADFIFDDGIVVPSNPEEAGFPIFERGGNDPFNLSIIKELNSAGDPSKFGCVNSYTSSDWEFFGQSINTAVLSGFPNEGGNLIETANVSSQQVGVIFVSFEDLGLSPGDVIYGYSLAASDTTTDSEEFLAFNNSTFFPTNTSQANGGLDLLSGGSFSRRAFIHTVDGWYQNDNPNNVTTTCEDFMTISGGDAVINDNKVFGEVSVIEGSLNLQGNRMEICANLNPRFDFSVTNGTLVFNGAENQKIRRGFGNLSIDGLEINNSNGLEVNTAVDVFGFVEFEAGNLTVNREFTFRCDFSGVNPKTAFIGELKGSSTIIGEVSTEQCFPQRRAFRFVSPTVSTSTSIRENWQEDAASWDDNPNPGYGTHITGLGQQNPNPTNDGQNGFDWQPSGNPSMFVYDNNAQQYAPVTNTDETSLEAGRPYRIMIRGSRDVNLQFNASPPSNTILKETGEVKKGPFSPNYVPTNPSSNQAFLVGNPFQSTVDLREVYQNSSNILPFVAVWDPTLGGMPIVGQPGGRGAFLVFSILTGNSSVSNTSMNRFLQPKQAVFFYANGNGTPNIVFNESDKEISAEQTQVFSEVEESYLQISLYDQASFNNNKTPDDGIRIDFVPNGNNLVDDNDALKISNQDENLARMFGNHLISYEQRDFPVDNEILPLFINQYRDIDYVFEINNVELPLGTKAFLRDNYLDTTTELPAGVSTINFSIDSNIGASTSFSRFSIVFEVETLSVGEFNNNNFSVYPNPLEGSDLWVEVDGLSGEEALVQIYDTLGRKVKTFNQQVGSNGKIHLNNIQLNQGLYLLELTSGGKKYMSKFVKK